MKKLGAIETGGTKIVCAVGYEDGTILEQVSIKSEDPSVTMKNVIDYFRDKDIEAFGVAAFGPVGLEKDKPTYGKILNTPKLRWQNFDVLGTLKEAYDVPMEIETDVAGSCLGEVTFGSSKGLSNVVYITIGTGIGAGIYSGGKMVHGQLHPEVGHMILSRRADDTGENVCPFHDSCLEGLAAGPSIGKRWNIKGDEISDDDIKVWDLEAHYIAEAIVNLIYTLCPDRFILGGGVMHHEILFPLIREKVVKMINGYLDIEGLRDIDNYIVPASLHDDQGIMGCLELARRALKG